MRPKKTILCVDDNEQALAVRKFLLETRGGYRVVAACNGEEAMERFRAGGIDLVLSDLVMPKMDGNELVRRMKEIAPEVPMILISGSVRAFDHANRADAFLPKGSLDRRRDAGAHPRYDRPQARSQKEPSPGVFVFRRRLRRPRTRRRFLTAQRSLSNSWLTAHAILGILC